MNTFQPDRYLLKEQIKKYAHYIKGAVLDAGSGDGERYKSFFKFDRYVTFDINSSHGAEIVGSVEDIPVESESFDSVVSTQVLEHVKNLGLFVDECYRVLKKDGKIWMRTDYAGYLPFHLLKNHEHNKELDVHYKNGFGYGHGQNEDAHYHLFVESHLDKLFKKFRNKKFSYFYGGGNLISFLSQKCP